MHLMFMMTIILLLAMIPPKTEAGGSGCTFVSDYIHILYDCGLLLSANAYILKCSIYLL